MHKILVAASLLFCLLMSSVTIANSQLIVLPLQKPDQAVITPSTLGILVNANDPQSVQLGREYAAIRGVPTDNIIELQLPRVKYVARSLMIRELQRVKDSPNYERLAAFALAFAKPYRVDANQSITSAFSQGIVSMKWQGSCNLTPLNPDAGALAGAALRQKPSMMLSGGNLTESIALAERGKKADATDPPGNVLLIKTNDVSRSSPREASMDRAFKRYGQQINIENIKTENYSDRANLIGFQIGLPVLEHLDTLHFLPGAYADHLTSYGGALEDNKGQTIISALVDAGATASFGTVREPCNFKEKFPDSERMLGNYLQGDSILEAYWKSVGMMTEGLLVGEPLARPFPIFDAEVAGNTVEIKANRHSVPYLDAALSTHEKGSDAKTSSESYVFSLYNVQSGRPKFMRTVTAPKTMRAGDTLDRFDIPQSDLANIIIGVKSGE